MLVTNLNPRLYVCLDNLRSAYNVGSIFRTCDSVVVHQLALCGITPTPLNHKLDKTALSAALSVSWVHYCRSQDYLNQFRQISLPIIVWETHSKALSLFDSEFPSQAVFVFGNEIDGVNQSVLTQADAVIKIPQYGQKQSLNVATAVGIALYSWRRQHPGGNRH